MNISKIFGLLGGALTCIIGALGICEGAKNVKDAIHTDKEHSGSYPWGKEEENNEMKEEEEEYVIEED